MRPYNVVDLFAGVDFGRFDLEVYAKNVFNSHGVTSTLGRPRLAFRFIRAAPSEPASSGRERSG